MENKVERHSLAVFLAVKNCAALLERCLSHLSFADEILVGDASDNDEIQKLLQKKFPAVRHFFDKNDDFRRRLIDHLDLVSSDFILVVDSDEFYTPKGGEEILKALTKPCAFDGFEIPSVSYNYGVCFGEGATQMRLFRKDQFFSPMRHIHEMPEVGGAVGRLKEPYEHHNNPILGINAVKHFRYEAMNALGRPDTELESKKLDGLGFVKLTARALTGLLRINWRFLKTYWAYRRFGFAGLCMAYSQVFQTIASQVCPTEEWRMRKGSISRDRRGYY
jgi:glycosyltransferase involved in cell wall biosynthesis